MIFNIYLYMSKLNLINILRIIIFTILIIFISNFCLHPITIISLILIYSNLACIIMTLWSFTYIYSIIIFLIIIRGILILFIYFARLISNEQHKISYKSIIFLISILIPSILYKYKFLYQPSHQSQDQLSIRFLNNCPIQHLFKLYDYPYNYITFISILFLLISLLLIIKIRSLKSSSLRKIN